MFLYFGVIDIVVLSLMWYLLMICLLPSTLKQTAEKMAKLISARRRQSVEHKETVNKNLAEKKHAEGLKKAAQKEAQLLNATPLAENKTSASKKRKTASSSEARRRSARHASSSKTGKEGEYLGRV